MSHNSKNNLLTIVLLSYQSEDVLPVTVPKVLEFFDRENVNIELLIIDDNSTDLSFSIAKEIAKSNSSVKAYKLAKNVTSPYSQFAGLSLAKGNCVTTIPDDLQRPLEHVLEMYRLWEKGCKLIIGNRLSRNDGLISDLFSNLYYAIMNLGSDTKFPKGGTDGYLIDREVVDILNHKISKKNTTPVIELLNLGYNPIYLPYHRPQGTVKSRWSLQKKINLAMNTFFSRSNLPLRLIGVIGLIIFILSCIAIIAIILTRIFSDNTLFGFPIPGWTTLMVVITLFNGLLMLSMGIFAEYLWRVHDEVKKRPDFIIEKGNDDKN